MSTNFTEVWCTVFVQLDSDYCLIGPQKFMSNSNIFIRFNLIEFVLLSIVLENSYVHVETQVFYSFSDIGEIIVLNVYL